MPLGAVLPLFCLLPSISSITRQAMTDQRDWLASRRGTRRAGHRQRKGPHNGVEGRLQQWTKVLHFHQREPTHHSGGEVGTAGRTHHPGCGSGRWRANCRRRGNTADYVRSWDQSESHSGQLIKHQLTFFSKYLRRPSGTLEALCPEHSPLDNLPLTSSFSPSILSKESMQIHFWHNKYQSISPLSKIRNSQINPIKTYTKTEEDFNHHKRRINKKPRPKA